MRKKNILCLSLAIILLLSGGCNVISEVGDLKNPGADPNPGGENKVITDTDPSDSDPNAAPEDFIPVTNTDIPIFDRDHKEIGSITCYNYSPLTDHGLLYTKIPENAAPAPTPKELEYHLYDIESGEDHLLGTVEDWYYESSYESVGKDGHLYINVSTGEYTDLDNSLSTIYDLDLKAFTMTPLLQIEGGIPYNSFTIVGDELVVAELLKNGDTDLIRIDLKNKPKETVLHKYDEENVFVHDSIRHMYADENNVYMLRVDWDEKEKYTLYLDTYDTALKKIDSLDITNTCVLPVNENDPAEIQNECRQFVNEFFVKDRFFFYQNFSVTTFLGKLSDQDLTRFAETDDLISYVNCSDPKAPLLFYRKFGDDSTDRNNRNLFYLIDPKADEIRTAEFYADNVLCTFRNASQNSGGKILLNMAYQPNEKGEPVPERFYYLDRSDLEFK